MTESVRLEPAQLVGQQLLVRLDDRRGALDVQVQQDAGKGLGDLFERDDTQAPVFGRESAQHVLRLVAPRAHGVTLDPPVRVVHLAQLGQGEAR